MIGNGRKQHEGQGVGVWVCKLVRAPHMAIILLLPVKRGLIKSLTFKNISTYLEVWNRTTLHCQWPPWKRSRDMQKRLRR
jgi:hypothetical protein